MRKILDLMFGNKRAAMAIPAVFAAAIYLLFVLFGRCEDKMNLVIITPIVSVFGFLGVFLVVFIQIKNKSCHDGFLNFIELFFTACFGICALAGAVAFAASGFSTFSPIICVGALAYSAIAWAHSKRKQTF